MKQRIFLWLLPKLLLRKSPHTIPRSGESGKKVNCFTIYLCDGNREPSKLVESIDREQNELHVLSLDNNNTFSIPEVCILSDVSPDRFSITHYFGLYELRYTNIYDLAFNFITKYDVSKVKCYILWDKISQSRFNKKDLVTKRSIELLEFMLKNQLTPDITRSQSWRNSSVDAIDIFSLMTQLHSLRWADHPHSNNEMKKLELYLDSLVESGDLKKNNDQYYVTGKALKTLEKHEENERRHLDAVGTQRKILWLTLIIACAAIIEADLVKPPPIVEWPNILYNKMTTSLR
jgi:hypothetical protein